MPHDDVDRVSEVSRLRAGPGHGEGTRACALGECAYLPEDLNVYCDYCRFDFFTMEGNSPCKDPLACDHAREPLAHVENYHRWLAAQASPMR